MMPTAGYTLTQNAAQATAGAVRFMRGFSREGKNNTPTPGIGNASVQTPVWLVKVTGDPITVDPTTGDDSSSGDAVDLYPAVWLQLNDGAASFVEQDTVWLLPTPGSTFETDDVVLARLGGQRPVDGILVYVGGQAIPPSSIASGETIGTGGALTVDNTWTSVGTTYSLPAAGTYQFTIRATGWCVITATSGGYLHGLLYARIFDTTNTAVVPGSTVLATEAVTLNEYGIRTFVTGGRLTVTGATNLRLQGYLDTSGATYDHSFTGFDLSRSPSTAPVFDWVKVG
jgi:hypothetical protein